MLALVNRTHARIEFSPAAPHEKHSQSVLPTTDVLPEREAAVELTSAPIPAVSPAVKERAGEQTETENEQTFPL